MYSINDIRMFVKNGYEELQKKGVDYWSNDALVKFIFELISKPIPMRLRCEECHELHIDEGEFKTKPHHTHACQNCGHVWRPAIVATVGVRFLPGFKN